MEPSNVWFNEIKENKFPDAEPDFSSDYSTDEESGILPSNESAGGWPNVRFGYMKLQEEPSDDFDTEEEEDPDTEQEGKLEEKSSNMNGAQGENLRDYADYSSDEHNVPGKNVAETMWQLGYNRGAGHGKKLD